MSNIRAKIGTDYLQAYLNNLLTQYLEGHPPAVLSLSPVHVGGEQLSQVETEITTVERQIDTLIGEQSLAPANVQQRYRERVEKLSERLDMLHTRANTLKREVAANETERRVEERAVGEINALTLERLWKLPDRQINQLLKRLLGPRKLVIRDKLIVGVVRIA